MANFLDLTGLNYFWTKVKGYIDSAKSTVGNYTVNGKKINTNPTISKSDVGLNNVSNDAQVKRTEMGAKNGVATLNSNGKIPSDQLPSFVDDMLEFGEELSSSSGATINTGSATSPQVIVYLRDKDVFVAATSLTVSASSTFYANWAETANIREADAYGTAGTNGRTPKSGVIYACTGNGKSYRYAGSTSKLVAATTDMVLGETSSTAYRGDRGKTAYDHAAAHGSAFSSGLYKITTNSAGHVTAATAVSKTDITNLGIPSSDSNPQFQVYYGDTKETLGTTTSATSRSGIPSIISSTNTATSRSQRLSFPQFGLKKDSTGVHMDLLPDAVLGILPTVTTSNDGLMSSSDKSKLDGLKNYTLPKATESVLGGIKLGGDNVIASTTIAEAATSVTSKIYAVQLNSAGKAVVYVPWTDTNTTYGTISTSEIDGLFS